MFRFVTHRIEAGRSGPRAGMQAAYGAEAQNSWHATHLPNGGLENGTDGISGASLP